MAATTSMHGYKLTFSCGCVVGGAGDSSDGESEDIGSKVTHSYQSKRTSGREGLQDMGATLTLETESTTAKVWSNYSVY